MAMAERGQVMRLGVVVERRELHNRWQRWSWRPVAVIPGAAEITAWHELARAEGVVRWHAATLPLLLHRKETEGYRVNLSSVQPAVYAVLRPVPPERPRANGAAHEHEVEPFRVTASAYEAQDHMDGDDIIEAVPMPAGVIAWVQAFIDRHHVDQPFIKRKRKRHDPDQISFARKVEPPGGRHGRS
jgi:hypothetical protein